MSMKEKQDEIESTLVMRNLSQLVSVERYLMMLVRLKSEMMTVHKIV